MQKKAIDISYAQGTVDFGAVRKSGTDTVIIRNGYLGKTDTFFERNMNSASENGFDIGTYTYIMSDSTENAVKEAEETILRLEKYKGSVTLPVFCDMESIKYYDDTAYSKRQRTDIIKTFCSVLEKAGYYAAVYINPSWLEQWVIKEEIIPRYDIWLAAWTGDKNKPTKYNYGQKIWQWGTDEISGISGKTDCDIIYADYPAQIKALGKNFLASSPPLKKVRYVLSSLGRAAVRSTPEKADNMLRRCTYGGLYAADAVTADGRWFHHISGGYSLFEDGAKLFENVGGYDLYETTSALNVRSAPGMENRILGVIAAGDYVAVNGNAGSWKKIVYNDRAAYVHGGYLRRV